MMNNAAVKNVCPNIQCTIQKYLSACGAGKTQATTTAVVVPSNNTKQKQEAPSKLSILRSKKRSLEASLRGKAPTSATAMTTTGIALLKSIIQEQEETKTNQSSSLLSTQKELHRLLLRSKLRRMETAFHDSQQQKDHKDDDITVVTSNTTTTRSSNSSASFFTEDEDKWISTFDRDNHHEGKALKTTKKTKFAGIWKRIRNSIRKFKSKTVQ